MDSVIQFEGTIYENGYGLIAQKVMRDKSLSKQAKVIYSYMCSFAGVGKDGERSAFPSISLQCAELGMSEDTYYKWRKQLISKGYIKVKKNRKEGNKFDNNVYSIVAIPVEVKDEEKPYPKNSGMEKPYPKNSCTENTCTENKGTIINSSISNIFKKEEEEDIYIGESEISQDSQDQKKIQGPSIDQLETPNVENQRTVERLREESPEYDFLCDFLKDKGITAEAIEEVVLQCEKKSINTFKVKDVEAQYKHMMFKVKCQETIYDFPSYFVGGLKRRMDLTIAGDLNEQEEERMASQRKERVVPLYNWLENRG